MPIGFPLHEDMYKGRKNWKMKMKNTVFILVPALKKIRASTWNLQSLKTNKKNPRFI